MKKLHIFIFWMVFSYFSFIMGVIMSDALMIIPIDTFLDMYYYDRFEFVYTVTFMCSIISVFMTVLIDKCDYNETDN